MADTIIGTVYKIGETKQISDKFATKQVIIKTRGEHTQYIPVEFTNKNIDKLDYITTGSDVEVSYNLRGRLWNSPQGEEKCFSTIEGWNIKKENIQVDMGNSAVEIKTEAPKKSQPGTQADMGIGDDLPF